jgi:hypothetical protein
MELGGLTMTANAKLVIDLDRQRMTALKQMEIDKVKEFLSDELVWTSAREPGTAMQPNDHRPRLRVGRRGANGQGQTVFALRPRERLSRDRAQARRQLRWDRTMPHRIALSLPGNSRRGSREAQFAHWRCGVGHTVKGRDTISPRTTHIAERGPGNRSVLRRLGRNRERECQSGAACSDYEIAAAHGALLPEVFL